MDACFGFVRKKSAGSSVKPPRYEMCMFGDQADVDNFIQQHSHERKKPENVIWVHKIFCNFLFFRPTHDNTIPVYPVTAFLCLRILKIS